MSNYLIWQFKSFPNACALTENEGLTDIYKLYEGDDPSTLDESDHKLVMDPETPDEMMLTDNLLNQFGLAVVSERFKSWLNDQGLEGITFMPVTVINHKNRPTDEHHFIVHGLGSIDCIDEDASDIRRCPLDPDDIEAIQKLVLDEAAIPADRLIFRMRGFGNALVVHKDLAARIDEQDFSGMGWKEIDKFTF